MFGAQILLPGPSVIFKLSVSETLLCKNHTDGAEAPNLDVLNILPGLKRNIPSVVAGFV